MNAKTYREKLTFISYNCIKQRLLRGYTTKENICNFMFFLRENLEMKLRID